MNRAEMDGLFALLEIYFPRDRRLRDDKLKKAWLLVLEPYPASAVKEGLLEYLRSDRYFPGVQDIASHCRRPPPVVRPRPDAASGDQAEWARRWRQGLAEQLERRGLSPFTGGSGAEYLRWRERCAAAGLDVAEQAMLARSG